MLEVMLSEADKSLQESLARLFALLEIPSISTDPDYGPDCGRAAEWLAAELGELGFAARLRPTEGHPVVAAHCSRKTGEGIVFYGHYDVQPVDPVDQWRSPPFSPRIENINGRKSILARGSSDDKGQLMTFVEALRIWKSVTGTVPEWVSILIEGEEECGSPSLGPFLEQNASEFRASIAAICDTGLFASRVPAIVTQLRGLVGDEFTVCGPRVDLHSGIYGGLVQNPINVVARMLAGLHAADGRVSLPGFYEGVFEPPAGMLKQWESLNFDTDCFLARVGLETPSGEQNRMPLEVLWSRPTCDVNGIWGGYQDAGFKTVLPASASAKVSFRLVDQQDPVAIRDAFRSYIQEQLPPDFRVEFTGHGTARACQMSIDNQFISCARQALADEWGIEAVFVGCGGSIPVAALFQDILGMDSLIAGFSCDDDNAHSPNEKYDIESFHKGIRSWLRVLYASQ